MIYINIVIWWPVIHKVRYMYFQIFTERIFFFWWFSIFLKLLNFITINMKIDANYE